MLFISVLYTPSQKTTPQLHSLWVAYFERHWRIPTGVLLSFTPPIIIITFFNYEFIWKTKLCSTWYLNCRQCRPWVLCSIVIEVFAFLFQEQYKFCHQAVISFIQTFDIYSNFELKSQTSSNNENDSVNFAEET